MECWSELLVQPKPSSLQQTQQLVYVKYTAPTQQTSKYSDPPRRTVVTLESRGLLASSGTTGFRTWEAALHLGTFLATPAGGKLVRGKKVLELGAGSGFLSMFCAKHLGVQRVVATDCRASLLGNIQDCVVRNQLDPGSVHTAIWEWGTEPQELFSSSSGSDGDGKKGLFDIALGADLVCTIP